MFYTKEFENLAAKVDKTFPDIGELPRYKNIIKRYIEDIEVFFPYSCFTKADEKNFIETCDDIITRIIRFDVVNDQIQNPKLEESSVMIQMYIHKMGEICRQNNCFATPELEKAYKSYIKGFNDAKKKAEQEEKRLKKEQEKEAKRIEKINIKHHKKAIARDDSLGEDI